MNEFALAKKLPMVEAMDLYGTHTKQSRIRMYTPNEFFLVAGGLRKSL